MTASLVFSGSAGTKIALQGTGIAPLFRITSVPNALLPLANFSFSCSRRCDLEAKLAKAHRYAGWSIVSCVPVYIRP
jgi:hypothetical protein